MRYRNTNLVQPRAIKKIAFTLAEVLITLGIIGIVAEMTIPTLMNNVQDLQFKSAAKEAYSKANQAFTLMKSDGTYTSGQASYYNASNDFKNNFMAKFKIVKDCGNLDECVAWDKSGVVYKTLNGDIVPHQSHFRYGQFTTVDGMFWAIDDSASYILITVDVNGYQKTPNQFGRDAYMFYIDPNGTFMPVGAPNSFYTSGHCARAVWSSGWGCMYNVIMGIDY